MKDGLARIMKQKFSLLTLSILLLAILAMIASSVLSYQSLSDGQSHTAYEYRVAFPTSYFGFLLILFAMNLADLYKHYLGLRTIAFTDITTKESEELNCEPSVSIFFKVNYKVIDIPIKLTNISFEDIVVVKKPIEGSDEKYSFEKMEKKANNSIMVFSLTGEKAFTDATIFMKENGCPSRYVKNNDNYEFFIVIKNKHNFQLITSLLDKFQIIYRVPIDRLGLTK